MSTLNTAKESTWRAMTAEAIGIPASRGVEAETEKVMEETAKLWNQRAEPALRRWEAGSNPPDGWYFVVSVSLDSKNVYRILDKTMLTPASVANTFNRTYWESWLSHCQIYGPIPTPEATP
jgi:hypothetical protein